MLTVESPSPLSSHPSPDPETQIHDIEPGVPAVTSPESGLEDYVSTLREKNAANPPLQPFQPHPENRRSDYRPKETDEEYQQELMS